MLTVFSFTNGRSTHECSVKSLCGADHVLLKNMDYTAALETCVYTCQTDFFLRLDDDMFLHPQALEYVMYTVNKSPENIGMFFWYLWEDYTQTICQAIKIYRTESMRDIGGFKFLPSGKTDIATLKALKDSGWGIYEDKSIIAIHARGTKKETVDYYRLWKKRSKTYEKHSYHESLQYSRSTDYQYSLRNEFLMDLNTREGTAFAKYNIRTT